MSIVLRAVLLLGALLVLFFVIRKLRRAQIEVLDSVFWLVFSFSFVVLAAFPQVAFVLSSVLGFESPANFVFLYVIALLLYREFSNTVAISRLHKRINQLVEEQALRSTDELSARIK